MKKIILPILFLFCQQMQAQVLKTKKDGIKVSFFSETPVENITAENKTSTGIILNDSITIRVPNKGFIFPKALMQEHFNENYMESEKYPYSTYRGKINERFDFSKDGSYPVSSSGNLDLHGVVKHVNLKGTMKVVKGEAILDVDFDVRLDDHKIERPQVVMKNIAEIIKVKVHAEFIPVTAKK